MFKALIDFAKTVRRDFLGFAIFVILAFIALFFWLFSRGALDPLIANFERLSREQFFWLVLIFLMIIFLVLLSLIGLSFYATPRRPHSRATCSLFVVVHQEDDKTLGIGDAEVTLALPPKPQQETTDAYGSVTFFFPSTLINRKCDLNARKEGYQSRRPMKISLRDNEQVFISLQAGKTSGMSSHPVLGETTQFPQISLDHVIYVTDRISKNELGFTITNPKGSGPIRITDIKVQVRSGFEYLSKFEDRFDLSEVDISGEREERDRNSLALDLSASKSIFYDSKIIRVNENDAASFSVRLYANEHLGECTFRLEVIYIDDEGTKHELLSDSIYYARKPCYKTTIEEITATTVQDVVSALQNKDFSTVGLLTYFRESDFRNLDIFSLLVDIFKKGLYSDWGDKCRLIKTIGYLTNNQARRDEALRIIQSLDDIEDFDSKYLFIENLIESCDTAVIPFALSLIENAKSLKNTPAPINIERVLESFRKAIAESNQWTKCDRSAHISFLPGMLSRPDKHKHEAAIDAE
jgi:hypothetical protein